MRPSPSMGEGGYERLAQGGFLGGSAAQTPGGLKQPGSPDADADMAVTDRSMSNLSDMSASTTDSLEDSFEVRRGRGGTCGCWC